MRLIDADAMIEKLDGLFEEPKGTEDFMTIGYDHGIGEAIALAKGQPTIDAVEVVRCKDCRYYYRHEFFGKPYFTCDIANQYMTGDIIGVGFEPPEDWYCADGERKGEE